MLKPIFITAVLFLMFSCSNEKKKINYKNRTISEFKKKCTDELYMGFKFGMTEEEANNHSKKLISDNIISEFDSVLCIVENDTFYLTGYSSKFPVKDYTANVLITPIFRNKKLIKLEVLFHSFPPEIDKNTHLSDIINLCNLRYGKSLKIPKMFNEGEKMRMKYFTQCDEKSRYIMEHFVYNVITFEILDLNYNIRSSIRSSNHIKLIELENKWAAEASADQC